MAPLPLEMKMLLPALLLKCGRVEYVECLDWDWSGARFVGVESAGLGPTSEAALPVDFSAP